VAEGAITSDSYDHLIRGGGLAKELIATRRESARSEEGQISSDPELDAYEHLWLFEVPIATKGKNAGKPLEGSCYWDRIPKAWVEKWKNREITDDDIFPESPRDCDDAFHDFIDSHIPRFSNLIAYEPFYLYCEKARRMLEDKSTLMDIPFAQRFDWKQMELDRMATNYLYGLNKYITIKEDGQPGGRRKFVASTPQAFLAYICNRRNHFNLVKGRQAAVTSEMMAIADIEMVCTPSWTGVFMVHKKEGTGKGLFRDKHQNTLQHMPGWIVNEIDVSKGFSSESTIIDFDPGDTKAKKGMDVSEFRLLSAEDSMVVNGKTPTISMFDECQNIPTYQLIKKEIMPSLKQFNIETGEMDVNRCIWAWGTGSSNNTGNGAFESDFKSLLESWQARRNTSGWVPLFFDWTCRPGMTRKEYLETREEYMSGSTDETKGLSHAERLSLFCAHYPSKPDDAFLSTHKTLIPMDIIVKQMQRISSMCINAEPSLAPVPGRFIPVFDESVEIPGDSPFAHPIVGVQWKPSFASDSEAPVRMFMDRQKNWAHRYFQGTDPIQNDGGHSRFSSVVWDAAARQIGEGDDTHFVPTVACVLNSRSYNPMELFVQCALMGMYYANIGQKACKELVEINVGHRYADFKCSSVFNLRESLLTRHQLLPKYRTGEAKNIYGIDLKGGKGSRKEHLYADVVDLLLANWQNIWYYDIWSQIRRISVTSNPDGSVQWGTQNKNVYNDDMVYAMGYADLCCRCIGKQPEFVSSDTPKYVVKRVLARDANLQPYYETVKVPMTY